MNENKIKLNFVLKIALILMLVAGLSGAIIVSINMFTEPIIEANQEAAEKASLQAIYNGASFEVLEGETGDELITTIYEATKDDVVSGYIYKVSGKNAYGTVTLLVGVNLNGNVEKVEILENTESFKKVVDKHINGEYQDGTIDNESIDDVDVKCGATYGAKLVKSLVSAALNHFQSNYKGGQE